MRKELEPFSSFSAANGLRLISTPDGSRPGEWKFDQWIEFVLGFSAANGLRLISTRGVPRVGHRRAAVDQVSVPRTA